MYRDNIPTIHLKSWSLHASLFDKELAAGLVPTLFAEDPDSAVAMLNKDLVKGHADIMKINRIFFVAEQLILSDALALLKKPREGAVVYPFKKAKISHRDLDQGEEQEHQHKKARIQSTSETGM